MLFLLSLLIAAVPVAAQSVAPEVLNGSIVPVDDYMTGIGVIVTDPEFAYDTFLGGATVLNKQTILSAAHVLEYLRVRDLFFMSCYDLSTCDHTSAIKLDKAFLFSPIGSDWSESAPVDVAVGVLASETAATAVSLGDHDWSSQDPVLIRGHGCIDINPEIYPEVQHQAVLDTIVLDGDELKSTDRSNERGCPGDSGSFWGVQQGSSHIQIGVLIRAVNTNITYAESVWKQKSRITDCMDTECPEIVVFPPAFKLSDDYYLAEAETALTVRAPGVLQNDAKNIVVSKWRSIYEDSSWISISPDGSFYFNPGQLKNGDYTAYYYTACNVKGECYEAQVFFNIVSKISSVYLPIISKR